MEYDFDLIVIGSGPAGQRAAIQAAKLGKRVAIVEKERVGRFGSSFSVFRIRNSGYLCNNHPIRRTGDAC